MYVFLIEGGGFRGGKIPDRIAASADGTPKTAPGKQRLRQRRRSVVTRDLLRSLRRR